MRAFYLDFYLPFSSQLCQKFCQKRISSVMFFLEHRHHNLSLLSQNYKPIRVND
ncbi:hypothetical protein FDUTEX481_00997 [Tolypothrix sp. PCC 7601]|nr:hypothetical protein FDUTEX481_00997 [Tolypothrix sp. PCC 7601]